jgi:integrase
MCTMRGSIDKLPSGAYRLRVMVDGRRHSRIVHARTKRLAELALADFVSEVGRLPADGHNLSVAQLLAHHGRQADWQATTRALWDSLTPRLPGWFTAMTVADVRVPTLARLWAETDLSPHLAARLHDMLAAAWKHAVAAGWIGSSPFAVIRPPAPPRSPIRTPTADQVRRVIAAAPVPWQAVAFTVAATTGMRRGEIAGLRWADVDLDRGELVVQRSIAYTPKAGVIAKGTKTDTARTIALDPATTAALARQRAAAETLAAMLGIAVRPEHHVFHADGDPTRPVRPDNVTQAWQRACTKAGVEGVRFHDLRHFTATQLLGAGVDVRTVSGRLGHARVSTTLDRYAAFIPARDQAAAEIMGRLVG